MWLGSLIEGVSSEDARKYDLIFSNHEQDAAHAAPMVKGAIDLQRIISIATIAVAGLLALAGVLAPARTARITDLAIGLSIAGLGGYRLYRARLRESEKTLETAKR